MSKFCAAVCFLSIGLGVFDLIGVEKFGIHIEHLKQMIRFALIAVIFFVKAASGIPLGQALLGSGVSIGLLPGTYDPPHLGHVVLAEEARKAAGLDYVVMIANDFNIHKPNATSAVIREKMLEALLLDHPHIIVVRPGQFRFPRLVSVTRQLKVLQPSTRLVGIIGSDVGKSFIKSLPFLLAGWWSSIRGWVVNARGDDYERERFFDGKPVQIISPPMAGVHSSSAVRKMIGSVSRPLNAEELASIGLHPKTYEVIRENHLYFGNHVLCLDFLIN